MEHIREYTRKYWHFLAGLVCVAVLGFVYLRESEEQPIVVEQRTPITAAAFDDEEEDAVQEVPGDIVVHIEGAVNSPGVFTLPHGSRVNDVLALAGGPREDADLARVNLAAFLADAQQIIIPAEGDEIIAPEVNPQAEEDSGLININTANEQMLRTLPGIGPVLAGNIITHRETYGPFATVEELQNVPRIGPGIMNNIRNLVTVH